MGYFETLMKPVNLAKNLKPVKSNGRFDFCHFLVLLRTLLLKPRLF